MKNTSLLIAGLLMFGVQVLSAIHFPLSAEEAYYWTWSRQLSLGYWEHPPIIAYGISFASLIFGKTVLAVRLPGILLYCLSAYLLSRAAKKPLLCFLFLSTLPFFGQYGMEAHPNMYVMSFICISVWSLYKENYFVLSLALAATVLSSANGWIFFCLCFLSLLWLSPKKQILMAIGGSTFLCSPFLYWFVGHQEFPMGFGVEAPPLSVFTESIETLSVVGSVVIIPFLRPQNEREKWLWAVSILGLTLCISSWVAASFLAPILGVLGCFYLIQRFPTRLTWSLLGIHIFLFVSFKLQLHFQIFPRAVPPAHRFNGGSIIADAVSAWNIEDIWTASPYDAAWIRFYSDKEAHTASQFGTKSQFDLWPKKIPDSGIFVQDQSSLFQLKGYSLHNPQQIAAYMDGLKEGQFVETNIWKTVVFSRIIED